MQPMIHINNAVYICRYNTFKNQWSVTPSMHTCRSAAGAAMLGNYIYVVGKIIMYMYVC